MKELIIGGARSGKSAHAERLARESARPVTYIATAEVRDEAMRERVERHRRDRPAHWRTVECDDDLAGCLRAHCAREACVIVDCLTLWLTRLIDDPDRLANRRQALLDTLPELPGRLLLVSNEVGLGVVPMGEISRRFVDETGRLHQRLAERCDCVVFMAAGLPLTLKEPPQ